MIGGRAEVGELGRAASSAIGAWTSNHWLAVRTAEWLHHGFGAEECGLSRR